MEWMMKSQEVIDSRHEHHRIPEAGQPTLQIVDELPRVSFRSFTITSLPGWGKNW